MENDGKDVSVCSEALSFQIYRIPLNEQKDMDPGSLAEEVILVPLPVYGSEQAACMDFYSANLEPMIINPMQIIGVSLGIKVAVPLGKELSLRPRSGLALNFGITLLNSPGIVDSDYRGEVKAIIQNLGSKPYVIQPFTRIVQGKLERCERNPIVEVGSEESLGVTIRGENGFGLNSGYTDNEKPKWG